MISTARQPSPEGITCAVCALPRATRGDLQARRSMTPAAEALVCWSAWGEECRTPSPAQRAAESISCVVDAAIEAVGYGAVWRPMLSFLVAPDIIDAIHAELHHTAGTASLHRYPGGQVISIGDSNGVNVMLCNGLPVELPAPRFSATWCSSCGGKFGPGEAGYSACSDHAHLEGLP